MKKIEIEVTHRVVLSYDPDSPEFKEALEGYIDCIDSNADEERMLRTVAATIVVDGIHRMVEGVGYINYTGSETIFDNTSYSGITVEDGFERAETEVI